MGRPRTLDYTEVRRLREKGWTVPAIAERKTKNLIASPGCDPGGQSQREGVVRVLLVDDLVLCRESLSRVLETEEGIEVAGQCGSIAEALQILSQEQVHIVLLHLHSGGGRGESFLGQLQQQEYEGRVLVVAREVSDFEAMGLIRNGVGGIFLTHGSPEQLIEAIRKLAAGGSWLDAPFVEVLMRVTAAGARLKLQAEFTKRELQVLRGVVEGLGNKEIGERLHVSESAVKGTLQQLFRKTEVRTRAQLVRTALERKIDFS